MKERNARFRALLLAAGRSTRLGSAVPKPFLRLRGKTVLEWNARKLRLLPGFEGSVVTMDQRAIEERLPSLRSALAEEGVIDVTMGGATRQDSTRLAYEAACRSGDPDFDLVLVHDAARPFFSVDACAEALRVAQAHGAAILGHYAVDTIKECREDGSILRSLDRERIFHAATPQIFRRELFEQLLTHAESTGLLGTDEAGLAESAGIPVRAVAAPSTNIKLTRPEDLLVAEALETLLDSDGN